MTDQPTDAEAALPDSDSIETDGGADESNEKSNPLHLALEWVVVIVVAVVVALVVRAFLFQSFWIKSGSMETTLLVQDRVMVNHLSYAFGSPSRGDIVVFNRPPAISGDTEDLIKRVIAVAGETVEGRDGMIHINGEALDEPYLDPGVSTSDFAPVEVPEGHLWLMGDNRMHSSDSRFFGPVSDSSLEGRAFFRFWPLGRIGTP